MKRPTKKEIKAKIDALADKSKDSAGNPMSQAADQGKPPAKKSSQRIRKQGI